jgi:hypothetical protein
MICTLAKPSWSAPKPGAALLEMPPAHREKPFSSQRHSFVLDHDCGQDPQDAQQTKSLRYSYQPRGHRARIGVWGVTEHNPELMFHCSPRAKFFEFFTVPIRNAHTRAAYYRAIEQFLAWVERAGYQQLEDIEPITVAAYIETLQRQAAPPTVKQHMAAIRMMFSWLTEKGVLAMNPAREVKTERFSRTEGKTPAFVDGEVQKSS